MNSIPTDFDYVAICQELHPAAIPPRHRTSQLPHSHVVRFIVFLALTIFFEGKALATTLIYIVTSHGVYHYCPVKLQGARCK